MGQERHHVIFRFPVSQVEEPNFQVLQQPKNFLHTVAKEQALTEALFATAKEDLSSLSPRLPPSAYIDDLDIHCVTLPGDCSIVLHGKCEAGDVVKFEEQLGRYAWQCWNIMLLCGPPDTHAG